MDNTYTLHTMERSGFVAGALIRFPRIITHGNYITVLRNEGNRTGPHAERRGEAIGGSMRIIESGDSGLVDVGIRFRGAFKFDDPSIMYTGWTGLPVYGHNVAATLLDASFFRVNAVQGSAFWSGSQAGELGTQEWLGDKPLNVPYTTFRDRAIYGSTIANLFEGDEPVESLAKQKGVKHLSLRGLAYPKSSELYTKSRIGGDFPSWGWDHHTVPSGADNIRYVANSIFASKPDSLHEEPLDSWLGAEWRDLSKDMRRLEDYEFPYPYVGRLNTAYPGYSSDDVKFAGHYQPVTGWYFGDRVFSFNERLIDVANIVFIPGWILRYIRIRHDWTLDPILSPYGDDLYGKRMYKISVRTTGTSYLCFNTPYDGPEGIRNWGIQQITPFSWSRTTEAECIPLTHTAFSVKPSSKSMQSFITTARKSHYRIERQADLIRPSVMVSYTDAMSTLKATQANYVEVLKEGRELFALIPSLVDIMQAFLKRKPTSLLDAGRRIGDLLSNAHLLYSFGFRPAAANAVDIKHMERTVGPALRALQSDQTVHGKMSFDLEGTPVGPGTLVTRSTLRMKGVSDDFVLKLLELDALGLNPTSTANLWDLVPWSWFADYFFNLGARYSVIDAVIQGLIRGLHYSVHSYTVYDTSYQVLLESHALASQDIQIKHYFREVSRIVPTFFGSQIDFQAPPGPDRGITAAILYQLLAGN